MVFYCKMSLLLYKQNIRPLVKKPLGNLAMVQATMQCTNNLLVFQVNIKRSSRGNVGVVAEVVGADEGAHGKAAVETGVSHSLADGVAPDVDILIAAVQRDSLAVRRRLCLGRAAHTDTNVFVGVWQHVT